MTNQRIDQRDAVIGSVMDAGCSFPQLVRVSINSSGYELLLKNLIDHMDHIFSWQATPNTLLSVLTLMEPLEKSNALQISKHR